MEFVILNETDFRLFLDQHPLRTFLQTPEIGQLRTTSGWTVHYVGIKQDNEIVAATMLLSRKAFLKKDTFYAPRGFLIDFKNLKLLTFFTMKVKEYIKAHNGFILRIDPYVMKQERDIDGNMVPNGFNNLDIIHNLEQLGFKSSKNHEQVLWLFEIDLKNKTADDVSKDMLPNTRNIIRNTIKNGIELRELKSDELDTFKKLALDTSERKKFHDRPLSYYQAMYQLFIEKEQIKFLIAEINLKQYIEKLSLEKETELFKQTKIIDNPTNQGKLKELQVTIDSLTKKINEAHEIIKSEGNMLVLSGGMFIMYGQEVIYLSSGNYKKYLSFGGQYAIQWQMINYALDHHFDYYNFYGITGNFDPKDKDYGIYKFKKGFNGQVVELIGEFTLKITNHYHLYQVLAKIKQYFN